MAYLVNITSRAERDLAQLYEEIEAGHSVAALKWYLGLKQGILSPGRTAEPGPCNAHEGQTETASLWS